MYLLDTNILSELARIHPSTEVVLKFHSATEEQLHTSSICIEEIRYGCAASPNAAERWQKISSLALWRVRVIAFDNETAILAGDLRGEWKKKGTPVGYRDGLIAATAKLKGLILVTRNVRHFDHVEGLKTENWFEPPAPRAADSQKTF